MSEVRVCMFNTKSSNIAGYCHHHNHYMTVKQIKCLSCLQKQCHHLKKNEEHKWWAQREQKRAMRQARKEKYM